MIHVGGRPPRAFASPGASQAGRGPAAAAARAGKAAGDGRQDSPRSWTGAPGRGLAWALPARPSTRRRGVEGAGTAAEGTAAAPGSAAGPLPTSTVAAGAGGAAAPGLDPAIPPRFRALIKSFQEAGDPMTRYKQLLHLGKQLPPLPRALKTRANRVPGCVSSVWVAGRLEEAGGGSDGGEGGEGGDGASPALRWYADSDSALTKGLAALVAGGLSGASPAEVLSCPTEALGALGFENSLTPSRSNGLLNMFLFIQRAAGSIAAGVAGPGVWSREGDEPGRSRGAARSPATPSPPALPAPATLAPPPSSAVAVTPAARIELAALGALGAAFPDATCSATAAPPLAPSSLVVRVASPSFSSLSSLKRQRVVKRALAGVPGVDAVALSVEAREP